MEDQHQLQDIGIVQLAHVDADMVENQPLECVHQMLYLLLKIHNTELNFMVLLQYRKP